MTGKNKCHRLTKSGKGKKMDLWKLNNKFLIWNQKGNTFAREMIQCLRRLSEVMFVPVTIDCDSSVIHWSNYNLENKDGELDLDGRNAFLSFGLVSNVGILFQVAVIHERRIYRRLFIKIAN